MQSMMSESPAKQLVFLGRTIENSLRACARILWFERIGMSLSREANFSPGRCCCIPCMVICFLWATSWWIGRHRLSVCLSVYKQLLAQCLRRIGCRIMFSPRSYACCVKHIYLYIYQDNNPTAKGRNMNVTWIVRVPLLWATTCLRVKKIRLFQVSYFVVAYRMQLLRRYFWMLRREIMSILFDLNILSAFSAGYLKTIVLGGKWKLKTKIRKSILLVKI